MNILHSVCDCSRDNLIVRNVNEPQEAYQQPMANEPYEPKLTQEDMGGESAQEDVGGARVMNLLKELETARSEKITIQFKT